MDGVDGSGRRLLDGVDGSLEQRGRGLGWLERICYIYEPGVPSHESPPPSAGKGEAIYDAVSRIAARVGTSRHRCGLHRPSLIFVHPRAYATTASPCPETESLRPIRMKIGVNYKTSSLSMRRRRVQPSHLI